MNHNKLMKKMISLLCALLLIVSTVFAGLTGKAFASAASNPPTNFTELSWTDFAGLECKKYVAPNPDVAPNAKGTYSAGLHQTLLNGNIIMGSDTDIRFAGSNGWAGLMIRTLTDGTLYVENSTFDTSYNGTYQPSDYGLTSFIDTEFNLKISTEISGNNYTFGIWVNDQMLGDYFILAEADVNEKGNVLGLYHRGSNHNITLKEVTQDTPPVNPDNPPEEPVEPPTKFTELSWTDFAGLECKEYVAPNPDVAPNAKGTYSAGLHQTLLNGNIIMGSDTDIRFAGSNGWAGLMIRTLTDGTLYVENSTFDTSYNGTYQPSDYGLTSFIDTEFNLKISTEISGNNYTFGIWVNDKMLGDYFTLAEADVNEKGNVLGFYHRGSNHNITLKEVTQDTPSVPTDFKGITWTDFDGLDYQEYKQPKGYAGTYSGSLNQTLFSGDVIMGAETDIRYAGMPSNPGWSGLIIRAQANGYLIIDSSTYDTKYSAAFAPSDYGLSSFANVQFNLKISTEIKGNEYTFGIWVNDQMLGDYFTLTESEGSGANSLGLYDTENGGSITLIGEPKEEPDDPEQPVEPNFPEGYKEIRWADFEGLDYQTYPAIAGDLAARGTYSKSLHETILNDNVVLGAGNQIRYAGYDGWQGLILHESNGNLVIINGTFGTTYNKTFFATDYGLASFATDEFNLKISTAINGTEYTFGVWVNDIMLGDYFTLAVGECIVGSMVGLYDNNSGSSFTLIPNAPEDNTPSEPIPFPKNYKVVTLEDFSGGIRSGFLASGSAMAGQLKDADDFHKVVFEANINVATKTPGDATYIRFAGSEEGWVGIGVETCSNGTMVLRNWKTDTILQTFTKETAGVDFYKEMFNLKVSFAYIDADEDGKKNDVQIGVYFNDVLYNNKLAVARNYEMSNYVLAYTDDSALHPFELRSAKAPVNVKPIKPDKELKEISFSSFGIEDAKFNKIDTLNFCTFGSYQDLEKGKTLDGTLFHGKVFFGKEGDSELRFGGLANPWTGIRITGYADGTIVLSEAEGDIPEKQFSYTFNPQDAGSELVGVWLDIKISTQFIDSDKDGEKDDVRLGIWLNDVLYMNEYIVLTGYAPYMGTNLSVYSYNPEGYIAIKSVKVDDKISLSMFGFDDDYKDYFKTATKDKVKGEPLGVTADYDTVDYKYNKDKTASEVELVDDNSTIPGAQNWKYGVLALAGIVVAAGLVICILLARKKKEK